MSRATVAITVDVDGEHGLACRPVPGGWDGRLSSRSEGAFGVGRGLDRVLDILASHRVRATFFVVGRVALAMPERLREVAAAGHEIAHHGFAHRPTHELPPAGEREELERGVDALGSCLGVAPTGYRSPAWELTPVTLELLGALGFAYDSSLMGDDRPYRLGELVELPVHWTLDDVPYLAFQREQPARLAGCAAAARTWIAAHDDAAADGRPLVYTIHPEHTGRAPHHHALEELLAHVAESGTPTVTASEACRAVP